MGPIFQKSILRYSVCRCERFVPGSWCASKFWHSQTFRVIVRCAWAFRRSPYGNAILFWTRRISVMCIGTRRSSVMRIGLFLLQRGQEHWAWPDNKSTLRHLRLSLEDGCVSCSRGTKLGSISENDGTSLDFSTCCLWHTACHSPDPYSLIGNMGPY